ncbi:phage head closure protein [Methylophaga sp. OBS4]|uniref:phage head closure protein n=1 Tax=Methylophaga sp. OBS4 TaxID=2991935 RepID=UPI0022546C16|nr:phage head closure protein [Methylophaga sp. OBS4]MCX4186770.1 phage head closure protein [Methylophaga sp. OBS4]
MYQVKAGKYRHRIAIEEPVASIDGEGRRTTTWQTVSLDSDTPLDGVPAEVLLGPGRESIESGSKQASIDARINFRWFDGLTQKMRIRVDGRIYNIESIEADTTGRIEWRTKCVAGMNEGD